VKTLRPSGGASVAESRCDGPTRAISDRSSHSLPHHATIPLTTRKLTLATTGIAASVLQAMTTISCFVCWSILYSRRLSEEITWMRHYRFRMAHAIVDGTPRRSMD
jgi:hypothetical protein